MRRLENLHHRNPPLLVDDECRDHTPLHTRFSMSDGYLTSAITQLRNLSSPPPKNFGMTSTTR
ncbi:MAG: hypothetical protein ACLRMJ_06700 [Alistipes finegoldii]